MPFIPVPDWNAYTTYQSLETVDYSYAVGVPPSIYNVITGQTSITGTPPTNGSGVLNTYWAATTNASSSTGIITAGTDIVVSPPTGTGTVTISQNIRPLISATITNPNNLVNNGGVLAAIIPCSTASRTYVTLATVAMGNTFPTSRSSTAYSSAYTDFFFGCIYAPVWISTTAYPINYGVYYLTASIPVIYKAKSAVPAGTLPTNTTYWSVLSYTTPTSSMGVVIPSRELEPSSGSYLYRLNVVFTETLIGGVTTIPATSTIASSYVIILYGTGNTSGGLSILPTKCSISVIPTN